MSTTTYGGLIYVGDPSFVETENSGRMTIDPWGMDSLTREFMGGRGELESFLDSVGQGGIQVVYSQNPIAGVTAILDRSRSIADANFPQMFAKDIQIDIDRSWAKITIQYRGVNNGRLPPPVVKFGYRVQSVTLPFGTDDSGISATFNFNATYATYTYVTRKQPRAAIFKSKLEYLRDSIQIVSRSGAGGQVAFYRGPSLTNKSGNTQNIPATGKPGHYNAVVEVVGTIDAQPDGQWWNCVETNELIITPLSLSNYGWVYQLGIL